MYMQASFKKAQRLHISHRGGPGHVGSPSFLWHRVTLLNTCSYHATSTTLCSAKRTTLCFCTLNFEFCTFALWIPAHALPHKQLFALSNGRLCAFALLLETYSLCTLHMLSNLHGLRVIIRKILDFHYDMVNTHSYLDSIQFFLSRIHRIPFHSLWSIRKS